MDKLDKYSYFVKLYVMSDKRAIITQAAIEVFSRYGIRKTTMGDIAEFAGVSRQTLYSNFSSKSEAFVAAVELTVSTIESDIRSAWNEEQTLGEKLDVFFQKAVIDHFDIISRMPDAGDLLNGSGHEGAAIIRQAEQVKIEMLAVQFKPYESRLANKNISVRQIAELCERSASSFKFTASDMAELKRLLTSLKQLIMISFDEAD